MNKITNASRFLFEELVSRIQERSNAVGIAVAIVDRNGNTVTTKKTSQARFKHRLFQPAPIADIPTIMNPVNRGGHQHPTPASMRVPPLPKGQAPEIS